MLLYEEDSVTKIEGVLDSLRPGFVTNGGDVTLVKYEQGVAYVHFVGSYIGYPSDPKMTVEMIERQLRMVVPEVERVERL
jgi:Fe-S cluster biogenesis protein NfuA